MKKIITEEFDKKFDNQEDITDNLDQSRIMKLDDFEKTIKTKKINVDFPKNILMLLDQEAKKIGVTRQSIIKIWIAERLKEEQKYKLVG